MKKATKTTLVAAGIATGAAVLASASFALGTVAGLMLMSNAAWAVGDADENDSQSQVATGIDSIGGFEDGLYTS